MARDRGSGRVPPASTTPPVKWDLSQILNERGVCGILTHPTLTFPKPTAVMLSLEVLHFSE